MYSKGIVILAFVLVVRQSLFKCGASQTGNDMDSISSQSFTHILGNFIKNIQSKKAAQAFVAMNKNLRDERLHKLELSIRKHENFWKLRQG